MKLSRQDYKELVNHFPFLYPRNVWTDKPIEDYDYDWCLGVDELPEGWVRLFLLYCKHMRSELIKSNYLDKFRFTQIKEKYGDMRLYNSGTPKASKCNDLEFIYAHLSTYVCENCGKPAKYESRGWIAQECELCKSENSFKKRRKHYIITLEYHSPQTGTLIRKISCKEYWDEYLKCLKLSDEEFLNYIKIEEEE